MDHKFVNLLSPRLDKFKRKSRNIYNFRCPICGDSKRNRFKSRGYLFVKKQDIFYKCHNCNASMTLSGFLKYLDPLMYKEYSLEKFKTKGKDVVEEISFPFIRNKPVFKRIEGIESIHSLDYKHPAKVYLRCRKIPEKYFTELYYTDNFKQWVKTVADDELVDRLKDDDARIVIPFLNKDKSMIAVQGRSIDKNNNLRYITVKIDKNFPKVYGLDRHEKSKQTYICEGPIDSLFLPNALAMGGSEVNSNNNLFDINSIWVYDNEPRNSQIVNNIQSAIAKGFKVCIWPNTIEYKDINDMIVAGYDSEQIINIINKNTFEGIKAKIKLNAWKRTK